MSFDKEQLKNVEFIKATANGLFAEADTDKSGFIDLAEFSKLLTDFSIQTDIPLPSDAEIKEIISNFDSNKDGKFGLEEFTEFIKLIFEIIYNTL